MAGEAETGHSPLEADIAWGQVQGERQSQQDRAACMSWPNGYHLMVLGDGMGGHAAGEVASGTVIESFRKAFVSGSELDPRERLFQALQAANYAIFDRSVAEPALQGMGTTLLAVVVAADALHWVSVGDSPLWLLRGREMHRLNEDHSIGGVLDRRAHAGEITYEEANQASGRSKLLEAVMGADIKRVDSPVAPLPLRGGDIVLLASDGVETCPCDELWKIAQTETSAADLVGVILQAVEAHALPAQDNATVVVLRLSEGEVTDTRDTAPSQAFA